MGIVAKNGILMLDFVDNCATAGYRLFEALVQSGRRRLRPVLMTSLTTFLGLLPLAYGVARGRHAPAAGHRGHRRPVHVAGIVAGRHAGVLLRDDAVARNRHGTPSVDPGTDAHTRTTVMNSPSCIRHRSYLSAAPSY